MSVASCGPGWSCIATKCVAITLIASAIGVADVFFLRKQQLELTLPAPQASNPVKPATPDTPVKPTTDAMPPEKLGTPGEAPVAKPPVPTPPTPTDPTNNVSDYMISLEKTKELFQRMMTSGDVRFVDARNDDDFVKGRIPTAVNLPPTKFSNVVPPEVDQLSRDAIIVIYCGGGECDASKLTGLRLSELGFAKILIFHDGFPAWSKDNQPVEK